MCLVQFDAAVFSMILIKLPITTGSDATVVAILQVRKIELRRNEMTCSELHSKRQIHELRQSVLVPKTACLRERKFMV